jgi:CBS domain containing-hemolysin-like protein
MFAVEFGTSDIVSLVVVLVLIVMTGFLAMAETALTRMNRIKATTLREEGRKHAATLARLVEHPERTLNPVLLLILLTTLTAATLVGIVADHLFGPWGIVIATAFEVVVIFVFAEAAPKTWAVQHGDRAALFVSPMVSAISGFLPLRLLARALIGLSNVILPGKGLKQGPFVSEEELLAFADVASEEGEIEQQERALIHSIIEFGDTVAREVMVPRPDMVAVEGRSRIADVIEIAIGAGFSRIPVYEQGIDDIIGVVYLKDLMRAEREGQSDIEVRNVVREAKFTPETKPISDLMREMQQDKFHMAVVVDEYGGTSGIVTLEDLIEELVGEITDEFDVEEPLIDQLPNGDLRVNARMPIDEVNELIDGALPEGDWDTVGGFVYSQLGHVPSEGETVLYDGRSLTAEKVVGRRIGLVRIGLRQEAGGEAPDSNVDAEHRS